MVQGHERPCRRLYFANMQIYTIITKPKQLESADFNLTISVENDDDDEEGAAPHSLVIVDNQTNGKRQRRFWTFISCDSVAR